MKQIRVYNYKNREMSRVFYLIGIVVMLISCGKDIDLFIPRANQGQIGDISKLKERLASDLSGDITYVLSVPCSGNRVYEVDKDLVVEIPADFVDLSQYPCTTGYFDLHITVCDSKGEIMVAGIPTVSEGKLLESRIEINLQIKQGLNHIRLAHGKQISLKVNDIDPRDRMELFYGNDDNTEWVQVDGDPAAWDNVANGEWFFQDTQGVISGFGYECFSDSTDWINIDVFYEVPADQRTDVCVDLPAEFTNKNTSVFMVMDDYNSVVHLQGDADAMKFCEPYGSTPIGFNVTFIALAEMGDDIYLFAKQSATITPNHTVTLAPVKTPYDEIKNYLLGL